MDDKVRDLFNRVRGAAQTFGSAAENTARHASRKAGSLFDVTKLNMQIFDLNADVSNMLKDAGQIVYNAHLGLEVDDVMLEQILSQIDGKNAQIMELRERINLLKNSRACPNCGAMCSIDDKFCKICGCPIA